MPAITRGAPARPRCDRLDLTLLAVLLTLLAGLSVPAVGPGRAARPWWERVAWNLQAWHAVRGLPGAGQEVGHFRVWLPGAPRDAAQGAENRGHGADNRARGVEERARGAGEAAQGAREEVPSALVEQLEAAYGRVTADLGMEPPGPVPLVLYRDRSALEGRMGAVAGGATGLYAAGVIHLARQDDLDLRGPLAHEMTHYLLDLIAAGRVPRWFQEGLAQLEEYRLTGKVLYLGDPASEVPWSQLETRFHELPDEVAYGASLSLVSFLYHEGGDDAVRELVDALSRGTSFPRAVSVAWGRSLDELDRQRLARLGLQCGGTR